MGIGRLAVGLEIGAFKQPAIVHDWKLVAPIDGRLCILLIIRPATNPRNTLQPLARYDMRCRVIREDFDCILTVRGVYHERWWVGGRTLASKKTAYFHPSGGLLSFMDSPPTDEQLCLARTGLAAAVLEALANF